MNRIVEILAPGAWSGPAADHATLDYDGRHRRRMVIAADHGLEALLDLPEAKLLPGGCGLRLDDGRLIEIIAKPEKLYRIEGADAPHLLRLSWHIGNRHLAAQVFADHILIREDRVIGHMLEHLGARVTPVVAPFDPEGGAYHGGHSHDHDHDHHDHVH